MAPFGQLRVGPPNTVEGGVDAMGRRAGRSEALRRRVMMTWDRTMLWLQRYLALDVHPWGHYCDEMVSTPSALPMGAAPQVVDGVQRPKDAFHWSNSPADEVDAVPSFSAGDRPAEALEVMRIANTGSFGTTYLAHHEHWNIDLIIEVPSPDLAAVSGALAELAARAEQWKLIGLHPLVAACYQVHWLNGVPLRVRESVDGADLRAWITGERGVHARTGLDLAVQVCHALEHAHSRGIVHGYLTPESILITQQGTPKLTDFGARASTGTGSVPLASSDSADGDPATVASRWRLAQIAPYVAPERWDNALAVDAQSDVFSLGVCLCELFTGHLPYPSTTGAAQPLADSPGTEERQCPSELWGILRRCVEWNREERLRSVEELRVLLSSVYETLFGVREEDQRTGSLESDEWNNKAVSCFCLGQEAEAETAWALALEADPRHLDSLFNQGLVRWRSGELTDEQLIQQIEAVPVERHERWKPRYFVGLIHQERGDTDNAITMVAQAARDGAGITELAAALDGMQTGRLRMRLGPSILNEHRQYVSAACLSADGQLALSASYDGRALLWDVRAGSILSVLQGSEAPLWCAWLTPDGSWAVTGGDDHMLRVWEVATGECRHIMRGHAGGIAAVSLSADGRVLLWSGNFVSHQVEGMTVQLWDAQAGCPLRVLEGHTSSVKAVWLSPDARWALTGSDDGTMRLWDVATGHCEQVFEGHQLFVSAVCLSSDGAFALSGSWDQTLRLWDVQSGRCLRIFKGHRALVTSVCLTLDSRWALSGSWDCTVRLWDVATGRCVYTLQGHSGLVTAVAMSADGRRGLSGSWDRTVRVWELAEAAQHACAFRLSEPRS